MMTEKSPHLADQNVFGEGRTAGIGEYIKARNIPTEWHSPCQREQRGRPSRYVSERQERHSGETYAFRFHQRR